MKAYWIVNPDNSIDLGSFWSETKRNKDIQVYLGPGHRIARVEIREVSR